MKKNIVAAVALIVLLLVQVALAAISVDTSGSFTDTTSTTPHTLTSFTVASQPDRVLVATYGAARNDLASSMTFNGDSLTNVAGADATHGSFNASSGIYYRVAPDVATGDVVLNLPGNGRAGICAISLYGADQSTPITDSDEATGSSETSATLTLTTTPGDYVVYGIEVRDENFGLGAITHTAGSATGEVEIAELVIFPTIQSHGCSYVVASGSSTQIGYSWNVSTAWVLVAAVVHPSASATSNAVIARRRR